MFEWLSNPWGIGIGGGILSGLVVTVVSRRVFSRGDRGEYIQKLQSANREIIYALRPGISEGHGPDRRVVESLINATARKYAVDKSDLHDATQIGEELAKEIMDSSFISAKTKREYCNQLDSLTQEPAVVSGARLRPRSDLAEYRSRMAAMMSVTLGVTTAVMTVAIIFYDTFDAGTTEPIASLLPVIVALFTTFVVAMSMLLRNTFRRLAYKEEGKGRADNLHISKKDGGTA